MKFQTEQYQIRRLNKIGTWLVECENSFDLAMLFLRAQEFYESPNPDFRGKSFLLLDYMRWYALEVSDEHSFSYNDDFEGFNIPSTKIDEFLNTEIKDANRYDMLFAKIVSEIKGRQQGEFCLIGIRKGDIPTLNHELSHTMWQFQIPYQKAAKKLIRALPPSAYNTLVRELKREGYGDSTMLDEIAAYLATGLTDSTAKYEHLRYPFILIFLRHKKEFLDEK